MKLIRDVFFIVVFVSLLQAFMQRDMRTGIAPELVVKTIRGENVAELITDKPAIIYFWGSWCGICTAIISVPLSIEAVKLTSPQESS